MELSCGPPATTARHTSNDTTVASEVPPKAALRADHAPPRDGRPGSWSDWLGDERSCEKMEQMAAEATAEQKRDYLKRAENQCGKKQAGLNRPWDLVCNGSSTGEADGGSKGEAGNDTKET